MSRERITSEVIKCDLCGNVCNPVQQLRLVHSYSGDSKNEIILNVSAYIPYGISHGDVCRVCLNKALKYYITEGEV